MNTITPGMDRLQSRKEEEDANKRSERGERSEDSPNQELMMKTFSTASAMHTEERGVKAGHHYSNLLALLLAF
jgi:hypothetical protein